MGKQKWMMPVCKFVSEARDTSTYQCSDQLCNRKGRLGGPAMRSHGWPSFSSGFRDKTSQADCFSRKEEEIGREGELVSRWS